MPQYILSILLPIRWFLFEKVIEALVAKHIYHRNLQQLEHYARKDCFMEDAKEFDSMISFYHGLGMIIKHRSTVVLKAQWLIDLFKQLITIPPFNKQVENKFHYRKASLLGKCCSIIQNNRKLSMMIFSNKEVTNAKTVTL